MMARLMGVTDAQALARACDLGVAMQLTNIIRDVGEDARAGRLYLPLDWLDAAGIEPEAWRAAPAFTPALGSVLQRLQRVAAELYERSECGIVALPPACRPGIFAARYLYAGIGDEVARRGWNSVDGRAVLSASWKIRLLMQALYSAAQKRKTVVAPPLEETRFLVEAAADADALTRGKRAPAPRLVWLIDLFERLERREQAARIGSSF
jgi:phytoene synthase